MPGNLLLLPNLLGDHKHHQPFLPASVDKAVSSIQGLIAESDKGGRRFLSRFDLAGKKASDIPLALFKGKEEDLDFYLEPMMEGQTWGMISDAGLPCIADPGARLVTRARQKGILVKAFVGPCSISHALMLSGFSSQHFSFHGYLPRTPESALKKWEQAGGTQIFIEAPYRSQKALEICLENLKDETMLCVAADLTLPGQVLLTHPVRHWKKMQLPNIEKKPTVFLFATTS